MILLKKGSYTLAAPSIISNGGRKPFECSWECLKTCDFIEVLYCIAKALTNAQILNVKEGYTFAGSYAGGVFYSTNHGANWTEVNSGMTDK
jgi:hypothetical protein